MRAARKFNKYFPQDPEEVLGILRELIECRLGNAQFEDALFFAQKLVDVDHEHCSEEDFLTFIKCLEFNRQHQVIIRTIESRPQFSKKPTFLLKKAKAQFECQLYEKARYTLKQLRLPQEEIPSWPLKLEGISDSQLYADVLVLLGKLRLIGGEHMTAIHYFKEALKYNKYSYEAFEGLLSIEKHSLSEGGREEFDSAHLPPTKMIDDILNAMDKPANPADDEHFQDFIVSNLLEASRVQRSFVPHSNALFRQIFKNTAEHLLVEATNAFECSNLDVCLDLCNRIRRRNPSNRTCIILIAACLSCIKQEGRTDLFKFANEIIRLMPNTAVAWYVCGVYEYCIALDARNQQSYTRRLFTKAIDLDENFVEAYIGLGHALSIDGEKDHACQMYFDASKVDPTNYKILYFLGAEQSINNQMGLSQLFLEQSLELCRKQNRFHVSHRVLNDIGYNHYLNQEYSSALASFEKALDILKKAAGYLYQNRCQHTPLADAEYRSYFHGIHMNLAHTHSQLRNLSDCLRHLIEAKKLVPDHVDTIVSIAFVAVQVDLPKIGFEFLQEAASIDPCISNTPTYTRLLNIILLSNQIRVKFSRESPREHTQNTNILSKFKLARFPQLREKDAINEEMEVD